MQVLKHFHIDKLPEARQWKPARQQPSLVCEPSVQVPVQLCYLLVQNASDLLPMQAAAGGQNDQLREGFEQIYKMINDYVIDATSMNMNWK